MVLAWLDTHVLHSWTMNTRAEIAQMLSDVNVADLARESGISTKTIYRLRHQHTAPTLGTVETLLAAIARLQSADQQKQPA